MTTGRADWSPAPRRLRRALGHGRTRRAWAWVALGAIATLAVLMHVLPSNRAHPIAAPVVSGVVTVEAQWGSGPWYRLATANAENGGYRIRYELARPGVVNLRIALPDGNYAVATITVVDPPSAPASA